MHDRVERIIDQVEELDENNMELQREVRWTEKALEACEISKAGKNPGVYLNDMLKKWNAENIETNAELEEYAKVLWVTREQFEKQLRDE